MIQKLILASLLVFPFQIDFAKEPSYRIKQPDEDDQTSIASEEFRGQWRVAGNYGEDLDAESLFAGKEFYETPSKNQMKKSADFLKFRPSRKDNRSVNYAPTRITKAHSTRYYHGRSRIPA